MRCVVLYWLMLTISFLWPCPPRDIHFLINFNATSAELPSLRTHENFQTPQTDMTSSAAGSPSIYGGLDPTILQTCGSGTWYAYVKRGI